MLFLVKRLFWPIGKWTYYANQGITYETPLGLAPCPSYAEAEASARVEIARYGDLTFSRIAEIDGCNYNDVKALCIDERLPLPVRPARKKRGKK